MELNKKRPELPGGTQLVLITGLHGQGVSRFAHLKIQVEGRDVYVPTLLRQVDVAKRALVKKGTYMQVDGFEWDDRGMVRAINPRPYRFDKPLAA